MKNGSYNTIIAKAFDKPFIPQNFEEVGCRLHRIYIPMSPLDDCILLKELLVAYHLNFI